MRVLVRQARSFEVVRFAAERPSLPGDSGTADADVSLRDERETTPSRIPRSESGPPPGREPVARRAVEGDRDFLNKGLQMTPNSLEQSTRGTVWVDGPLPER